MEPKTPSDSQSVLAHWSGIAELNGLGTVHGGVILKLIDEAAALTANRHSRAACVTGGFDRVSFLSPVPAGNLVTLTAVVTAVWHTSMEVLVRVEAENPRLGERHHTCTAYVTMVAVDDHGHPQAVPPLRATNADEERRMREAQLRRENRLAERAQIEQGRQQDPLV
jgi:acyl-CoA hydrolase